MQIARASLHLRPDDRSRWTIAIRNAPSPLRGSSALRGFLSSAIEMRRRFAGILSGSFPVPALPMCFFFAIAYTLSHLPCHSCCGSSTAKIGWRSRQKIFSRSPTVSPEGRQGVRRDVRGAVRYSAALA